MIAGRERLLDTRIEWLEADGLGGFASGTPSGIRTRRYHGLLCAARTPPTGRVMLVNAVEAWIDLGRGPRALGSHRYLPGVTHPDGAERLVAFTHEPFPSWTFELEDGIRIVHELFVPKECAQVVLVWRFESPAGAARAAPGARLTARPLLSFRDVHALRRESASAPLDERVERGAVRWRSREGGFLEVLALASGPYRSEPYWCRDFLYEEDRARGYDHVEDLWSPGYFELELGRSDAGLVFAADVVGTSPVRLPADRPVARTVIELRAPELERRAALDPLDHAAEAFVVRREDGRSLIAGYPWFTDWGRDTFIALRGLLLGRGKVAEAAEILRVWAEHVSQGMLPNRFPDRGGEPEFNSVDASLWFVVAVEETLAAAPELAERAALEQALLAILAGYSGGTRFGIRADADGLLACGEAGTQLTWMDAKFGGRAVTPRVGKPVEIQALWIHALAFAARLDPRYRALETRARASFAERFWNEERGCLNDVVDVDHVRGTVDASLRPNQVLAIGGLPAALVGGDRARRIVDTLERELLTPFGLRTLARDDPRYAPRYEGGPLERDRAYHQGTAWPWLLGPFVEAWVRVRGSSELAKEEARVRFLPALRAHLEDAGLGHVSEIADAEPPHVPRGAPFQAWSLGELLRLERVVLAPAPGAAPAAEPRPRKSAKR